MRLRPLLLSLALGLVPLAAAGEGAALLAAAAEPAPAAGRFAVSGDRLVYDTETDGVRPGSSRATPTPSPASCATIPPSRWSR